MWPEYIAETSCEDCKDKRLNVWVSLPPEADADEDGTSYVLLYCTAGPEEKHCIKASSKSEKLEQAFFYSQTFFLENYFYRPQTKLLEGKVFPPVGDSVHRVGRHGRGACVIGGMHGGRDLACMAGGCAWQERCA